MRGARVGGKTSVNTSMVEHSAALAILAASSVRSLLNLVRRRAGRSSVSANAFLTAFLNSVFVTGHPELVHDGIILKRTGEGGEKGKIVFGLLVG